MAALAALLAGTAPAEDLQGRSAVGTLTLRGRGIGCTAVLIEPDLVLTAAHCLANRVGRDAPGVQFRPSTPDGTLAAPYEGARVIIHPSWQLARIALGNSPATISRDLALLRLARAVAPADAVPIPVAPLTAGTPAVEIDSFPGGRTPLRRRMCPLRSIEGDVWHAECAVERGESGAPVLIDLGAGARVVGIVSSRSEAMQENGALGATLAGDAFRLLLDAAR